MARLAAERNLRVVIVSLPSKEEVYFWALVGASPWSVRPPAEFGRFLDELAVRHGLEVVDLSPALTGAARHAFEDSRGLIWWRDDTHWNVRGHAIAAEAVYDQVWRSPARAGRASTGPARR